MADYNPWKAEMLTGNDDLDMVTLSSPGGEYSCDIYAHGATVTSWKHNGEEKLFCSEKAIFNGVKAIRGGIPVVFPQFGQPNKAMAQHGFARNSPWNVNCFYNSETSATVVFSLSESVDTLSKWPHEFELNYFVTLSADNLTCELKMCNTGDEPFSCQGLLHTYFAVPDVTEVPVTVHGLHSAHFVDKVTGGVSVETETREQIPIDREVDRVYSGAPGAILPDIVIKCGGQAVMSVTKSSCLEDLADAAPSATDPDTAPAPVDFSEQPTADALALADAEVAAQALTSAFISSPSVPTDVVVWNLWAEKATAMSDMGDEEYRHFLCVEPGCVSSLVQVPPGKRLALKQVLTPQ